MSDTQIASTHTAVIVVDVQAGTLSSSRAVTAAALLENIRAILDAARRAESLVVFALTTGLPKGTTTYGSGPRDWPDEFIVLEESLGHQETEPIVRRAGWSAFASGELSGILTTAGVSAVVITGLATTFGVESTARDAYDADFDVIVAVDAVSDPSPEAHALALESRLPALSKVLSTQQILDLLADDRQNSAGS